MTNTYNVHIYREMRVVFKGIEANSHEAAAAIAHDKPTEDADEVEDCNGDDVHALVDVQGDEEYEHSRVIDFEPSRLPMAASKMLAALKAAEGFVHWALDHDADQKATAAALGFVRAAIAEAGAAGLECPAPAAEPIVTVTAAPPRTPYSVLLLYPDYANDGGSETYYAFVDASDALDAVAIAQHQAVAAQLVDIDDPTDFAPLLVTEGHHRGEALFNK